MLKKIKEYISQLSDDSIVNNEVSEKDLINNACSALLIETALADKVFSQSEMNSMKRTLKDIYKIDENNIEELIKDSEKKVSESTSLYEYTRLINDLCGYEDKVKLVKNLWLIAFSDNQLDKYEEYLIRKISDLLHVSHKDFIEQKLTVKKEF